MAEAFESDITQPVWFSCGGDLLGRDFRSQRCLLYHRWPLASHPLSFLFVDSGGTRGYFRTKMTFELDFCSQMSFSSSSSPVTRAVRNMPLGKAPRVLCSSLLAVYCEIEGRDVLFHLSPAVLLLKHLTRKYWINPCFTKNNFIPLNR